jgi:uncharacterized protein YbbC (DUF1343 family)
MRILLIFNLLLCSLLSQGQKILPGAYQTTSYIPLLQNKKVAIFANATSVINQTHLADSLVKLGVNIVKIFGPEHGFRGDADAGEKVGNAVDPKLGIEIISLYGKNNKPTAEQISNVDVLLFDIQDVGIRYYTYISSLQYYIEAAIENQKQLVILDRPNPNGHYVDGPILEPDFKSFIGMQKVPIVYGMTLGEYAQMLVGEQWLNEASNATLQKNMVTRFAPGTPYFNMTIIPCENYTHKSMYSLPVKPSPNLPNMQSIYLYSSTCFFEGTVFSLGRGTNFPFQAYGHPTLGKKLFKFTPQSTAGAKNPPQLGNTCYGFDLRKVKPKAQVNLSYILNAYKLFAGKDSFFLKPKKENAKPQDYFFNKLAGNATLMQQIKTGVSEADIRKSWAIGLQQFKVIRKKYLLYADFE